MCGIVGLLDPQQKIPDRSVALAGMTAALRHRGPDDSGLWTDADNCLGLGHRRLSILDLSSHGHQPMTSASGRYVISYNGEVYNFEALREELEKKGFRFNGGSDTEVILAAVEAWGLRDAVCRFVGMFAFALWDRKTRRLSLVRDRLGIKPLYFAESSGFMAFASELKALRLIPGMSLDVDRGALTLLLTYNYIPAPHTIYRRVHKLEPGHIVEFGVENGRLARTYDGAYWSARYVTQDGQRNPLEGSTEELIDTVESALLDAVKSRMIADVPLGAFLSGGIDSSTVVAMMQAQSGRPVKTFTIGFTEKDYNEAVAAKAVAAHLKTDHTELYVTPAEAREVIPRLPTLYDEPFSDSSQIPTFLVSQLARKSVTVALSGDGGDELFCGYNRYSWGRRLWKALKWWPVSARTTLARIVHRLPPERWNEILRPAMAVVPGRYRVGLPGDKLHKLAKALDFATPGDLYRNVISVSADPLNMVIGAERISTALDEWQTGSTQHKFTEEMMYYDLVTYLPDDILVKVDRASMGVGLEARVPILDHRVVELAWRLPMHLKLRNGQGKWILRRILSRYVPDILFERPKTGFGVPIGAWLRGPLRDWAENLLRSDRLQQEGFFNPSLVGTLWHDHLSGQRNWEHNLWSILMFQAWLEDSSNLSTEEVTNTPARWD